MRNKIIAWFICLITFFASSCVKEKPSLFNDSVVGAYLSFIGGTSSAVQKLDYSSIATATATIKVKNVGSPADKINIYVGTSSDKSTWKLIKTVSFTDSTTLTVNGAELAKALGVAPTALQPGTTFTFYNEVVTKDGKMFSAANTADDFQGQNSYKIAFVWRASVSCNFNVTPFAGNFVVVKDTWQDTNPGDIIVLTAIDATHFSFDYNPTNHSGTLVGSKPIIVAVNPATSIATIALQDVGTRWTYDPVGSTPPPTIRTNPAVPSSVNSCTGTISLNVIWSELGTDYPSVFNLKKQ